MMMKTFRRIFQYLLRILRFIICKIISCWFISWFVDMKKKKMRMVVEAKMRTVGRKVRKRNERKLFVQDANLVNVRKVKKESERFLQSQVINILSLGHTNVIIAVVFGQ